MPAISITALSDPVAIVHIPIALTQVYTTKIYWTIDRCAEESSEFFNITSNRIEMAIFGSLYLITHEWSTVSLEEKGEIVISSSWRVFEISSGDQDEIGNYDSPHLRHVSAPLAKAGISILYQSSYFTDFLLVKESDFEKARNIFANQGWQVDPSATPSPRRRSLLTPLTPSHPSSSPMHAHSSSVAAPTPEITVLSSPLACIGYSKSAENRFAERIRKFLVWPERVSSTPIRSRGPFDDSAEDDDGTESEVSASLRIERSQPRPRSRPFISDTRNEDGSSLVTEISVLRRMFSEDNDEEYGKASELIQSGGELFQGYDEDEEEEEYYSHSEGESVHSDIEPDNGFNGQFFTPPLEREAPIRFGQAHREKEGNLDSKYAYSLPPTPSDRSTNFDIFEDDNRSEYSVGEVPIKWSGKDVRAEDDERERGTGKKRCLQLDLRGIGDHENDHDQSADEGGDDEEGAYHLDKSGLVTRFSDLLTSTSKPIRMLYSSTFHTANILVEARDVKKAKRLLERKRRSVEWN